MLVAARQFASRQPFGRTAWRSLCHSTQPVQAPSMQGFLAGRNLLASYRQLNEGWRSLGSNPTPGGTVSGPAPQKVTDVTASPLALAQGGTVRQNSPWEVELARGGRRYKFGSTVVTQPDGTKEATQFNSLYTLQDGTRLLVQTQGVSAGTVSARVYPPGAPFEFTSPNGSPEQFHEVGGRFVRG